MRVVETLLSAAFFCGCVTPGSRPGDMSASAHEQRAADAERIAASRGPGKDAEETRFLRKTADDHRRAARALRDAETRACTDLGADESALESPVSRSRVIAVEPLYDADSGPGVPPALRGSVLRLKPMQDETVDRVKALIDCTIARHAVLGTDQVEARESPFAIAGVTSAVHGAGGEIVVELRTSDPLTAETLLARARRYAERR